MATQVIAESTAPEAGNPVATPIALPVAADFGNPVATLPGSPALAPRAPIDMRRIQALATRAESMVGQIRQRLLAPESRKVSPTFSAAQLATLCGVDKAHVNYRITKGDLPSGKLTPTGGKREFTLSEARTWTRSYRHEKMRPAGQRAIAIAVANFKGGVSKTTSSMILAQGLSLRGHRVLAIDIDPQGNSTSGLGIQKTPGLITTYDVLVNRAAISTAIQKTEMEGLDIVPARPCPKSDKSQGWFGGGASIWNKR